MTWRAAWIFVGFLALDLSAQMDFSSGMLGWLDALNPSFEGAQQEHFGLSFVIDGKTTKCEIDSASSFLCTIFNGPMRKTGQGSCRMTLQRLTSPYAPSLPLIRLERRRRWQQENPFLSQYVEERMAIGVGEVVVQSAQGYPSNIAFPLLLRAFDVVMQDNTVVSIVTKCDFREWPALAKEIDRIETSLTKVAKK